MKLPDGRMLWVFSDSWVGKRKGNARSEATLINNVVGIQASSSCDAPVSFHWSLDKLNKPAAFFRPQSKEGFFWPSSVVWHQSSLFVAMTWLKKNPQPRHIFDGTIPLGTVLVVIENPHEAPNSWRMTEHILSQGQKPYVHVNLKMFEEPTTPGELMIVGSEEKGGGVTAISLHKMRWERQKKKVLYTRTLQPDGQWSQNLKAPRKILFEGASQTSLHFDPVAKRYVAFYARGWEGIFMRTSRQLTGGWSASTLLFRFPELAKDKKIFCGTLGVHTLFKQASPTTPVLTYVCNSTNFFSMAGNMGLYIPIFLQFHSTL